MDIGTTKMIARKEEGIGWMIFNQPEKHNAVSYDMWLAVPKIIAAFEEDPEVRVIVLAGAGERAFVSGADISEFDKKRSAEETVKIYDEAGTAAHSGARRRPKPTITMIRGICYGGGLAIALNTDIRICSADSVFAVPAARLGLGYAMPASSDWLTWSGRPLPRRSSSRPTSLRPRMRASWASSTAWCRPELESYVRKFASTVGANAPLTVKAAKMAINAAVEDPERAAHGRDRCRHQGVLCQRRLHRRPPRIHGKAQAGVQGPVRRETDAAGSRFCGARPITARQAAGKLSLACATRGRQALPISMPVGNTSSPPTTIWKAAEEAAYPCSGRGSRRSPTARPSRRRSRCRWRCEKSEIR